MARYAETHEWARLDEDGFVTIGISAYAAESLGDITFVELPEEGASLVKGESFGVVESVKAASDLYAPVSGTVRTVNTALDGRPELVNEGPQTGGWMIRVEPEDPSELDDLMSENDYLASHDG